MNCEQKCLTEKVTDIGPFLLSFHNALQFGANVHLTHVIQEYLHHSPRQVCHPRHANKLTKLKTK